ncbi:hypothetical protein [Suicoccus acidiformans]|nr:hypothetical protein [Suicoccus acidiformans]
MDEKTVSIEEKRVPILDGKPEVTIEEMIEQWRMQAEEEKKSKGK